MCEIYAARGSIHAHVIEILASTRRCAQLNLLNEVISRPRRTRRRHPNQQHGQQCEKTQCQKHANFLHLVSSRPKAFAPQQWMKLASQYNNSVAQTVHQQVESMMAPITADTAR